MRILVAGSQRAEERVNYVRAVERAGGVPIDGFCPEVSLAFDGLLLCGGDDVDPIRFGEENCGSQGIDGARDEADLALAMAYYQAGKPILGVCRGHQVVNIALGGSLIQDIGQPLGLFHSRGEEDYDHLHAIRTQPDTVLHQLYGPIFQVNSSHHQAVNRLGEGLVATAWSESGLIEGMEHATLPILGVQFHPERMDGTMTVPGDAIFAYFVRRCQECAHGK